MSWPVLMTRTTLRNQIECRDCAVSKYHVSFNGHISGDEYQKAPIKMFRVVG